MPNQPKTVASSFRFSEDDLALMDDIGKRLALPGLKKVSRTDVLRTALHRLADSVQTLEKRPKKKR